MNFEQTNQIPVTEAEDDAFADIIARAQAGATSEHTDLTVQEAIYVELEREVALQELAMKPLREALKNARQAVIEQSGIRLTSEKHFFQDSYGVVHCVSAREFVTLPVSPYGIDHTRRPEFGEAKGSLSEKAAKEAGFKPVIASVIKEEPA